MDRSDTKSQIVYYESNVNDLEIGIIFMIMALNIIANYGSCVDSNRAYCANPKFPHNTLMFFLYLILAYKLTSLKGLAQAKIIKKSVILFRVPYMTIWCKHVHRLELQIFIIFVLRIHQLG